MSDCPTCGQAVPQSSPPSTALTAVGSQGVRVDSLRPEIAAMARAASLGIGGAERISDSEAHRLRMAHLELTLRADRNELSTAEHEVLETIATDRLLAENPTDVEPESISTGDRVADRVATFGGSWTFIISFFAVLAAWIVLNAFLLGAKPFDPYPFILLNLILSMLASIQAPIIMMSQNRKEMRDRLHAEHDYRINLKAEIEVRLLHEKLDHLMLSQWGHLLDVQEDQGGLLDEVISRLDAMRPRGASDAP